MKFDFNRVVDDYDKWFETDLGRKLEFYERRLFFKYLLKFKDKDILEIGTGTGHWTKLMSDSGFFITGIDIAEKMLKAARRKDILNTEFMLADAHDLPFPNESISNVVAVNSLEFVDDQDRVLDEIDRVLKPGGGLIVCTLNKNSSYSKLRHESPVFEEANLFTYDTLYDKLFRFGMPVIEGACLFPDLDNFEDADQIEEKASNELLNEKGNFLLGYVVKGS